MRKPGTARWENTRKVPVVMWLVCSLVICNLTAVKGNMMLVSLYALELGAGSVTIGTLFSAYAVAPIVLGVYAGRLSDSIGMRLPLLFGSVGMMLALIVPWLAPGLLGLFASVVLLGGAYVFYHVSIHCLVGAVSTQHTRARNFANYSLLTTVPYFIGPPLAGILIERGGYDAAYFGLAALPAIACLALLAAGSAIPKPVPTESDRKTSLGLDLLRNKPLVNMAVTSGLVLTSVDLFQFYAPIHAQSAGLTPTEIGMALSMYAVAAVAVRVVMPQLVARCGGEERLLVAALGIGAIAYIGFPLFTSAGTLAVMAFLLGAGLGCAQPISMTLTYAYAPPGRAGEGMGLRLMVNNAAHITLPFSFGLFTSAFGMTAVFWANAAILASGAVMTGHGKLTVSAEAGDADLSIGRSNVPSP